MIKNLIIALCIILITSITLNLNDICHCSQLFQINDCYASYLECSWNFQTNQCQDLACSDILIQKNCLQQSWRCYWNQGQCLNFTDCSSLQGANQSSCISQNIYCPASNGTICQSIDQLQTCTSFTSKSNCTNYMSAEGLCMWNGQTCFVPQSCYMLEGELSVSCNYSGCTYDNITFGCQPTLCSQILDPSQCSKGIPAIGPYLNNIVGCFWDSESNTCQEFSPDQTNANNCYDSSAGTYFWKIKDDKSQECISCFQKLLALSIIISILI